MCFPQMSVWTQGPPPLPPYNNPQPGTNPSDEALACSSGTGREPRANHRYLQGREMELLLMVALCLDCVSP